MSARDCDCWNGGACAEPIPHIAALAPHVREVHHYLYADPNDQTHAAHLIDCSEMCIWCVAEAAAASALAIIGEPSDQISHSYKPGHTSNVEEK